VLIAGEIVGATASASDTLADQERIKFLLGAGAVALVVLLALVGWLRARRAHRGSRGRRREVLALANSMIPPEVRAERPNARFKDLSSRSERSLWRRHGVMLVVVLCLPVLGLVSMRSDALEDALSWVGDHSVLVLAIVAPPTILFVVSQLRLATRSLDQRSELLGLRVVESPSIGVGVRGGAIKPIPVGGVVREGTRYGRLVQVHTTGGGAGALTRTVVEIAAPEGHGRSRDGRWVDAPQAWQSLDPGPGDVDVETGVDGVTVRRTMAVTASTADVLEAELSDLRLAEGIADRVPASGSQIRSADS
jgi:hypothetical protein